MMRGKFIVIESNDRAGKTTICNELLKIIPNSVYIKFPNRNGLHGKIIDDYLNKKIDMDNDKIYMLFVENRKHEIKNIELLLNSNKNIICDRYYYSGIVYALYNKGYNSLDSFNELLLNEKGLPRPDIIFLIKGYFNNNQLTEKYDNKPEIYNLFYYWFTNSFDNVRYIKNEYDINSSDYNNMILSMKNYIINTKIYDLNYI